MKRRASSSESDNNKDPSQDAIHNIRTKPPHIYDNITKRLLQLGITLAITTFIGLIVRYAVQEFDPTVSTITVTTSRINNRDIASLSVSKHFLERILEFIEESVAIVAAIIPLGFPLCSIFNKYFAKIRAGDDKIDINSDKVLNTIPKYIVIGDAQACQMPNSVRLRPLVRDTIYQLIKAHLKPKLIVEDSFEDARKLGIKIGLIKRDHHKLAVIKSVDLLKNITDSRGDIKQGKVRYLLSRMKIMSQATPADKSLLVYLMKHCESMPNENLIYLGYSFTDPEAMRIADCAVTFQDCDDDDVKKDAQVLLKSGNMTFTDLYLFAIVCLLCSNITQSYALYQISASVSCCLYRFLSITVFQEQLISHSQFTLLIIIQQVFAIIALMTKWLSSLPQAPLRLNVAEMSHDATEDTLQASEAKANKYRHYRSTTSISVNGYESTSLANPNSMDAIPSITGAGAGVATSIRMHKMGREDDDTLDSSSLSSSDQDNGLGPGDHHQHENTDTIRRKSRSDLSKNGTEIGQRRLRSQRKSNRESSQHIHLSGIELDRAVINSKLVTSYKQTFQNSSLIDDVTYRLVKLQIAYQVLVMIIIMIFGNAMFQMNMNNNRQHQTLALNSLILNNIFNLANCFNQFGQFNLSSGFRNHPFFVCILLLAVFFQVCLTELNAFGLDNLNPIQWFVCFVFALMSALISPLTGQQQRYRRVNHKSASQRHLQQHQAHILSGHHYHEPTGRSPNKAAAMYRNGSPRTPRSGGKHSRARQINNGRKSQASVRDE